jgi:hypothetical protein
VSEAASQSRRQKIKSKHKGGRQKRNCNNQKTLQNVKTQQAANWQPGFHHGKPAKEIPLKYLKHKKRNMSQKLVIQKLDDSKLAAVVVNLEPAYKRRLEEMPVMPERNKWQGAS